MITQRHELEQKNVQLEAQLAEIEQGNANRSTASEAQQRDIDIIQLRSEREDLKKEIESCHTEIETLEGVMADNHRSATDQEKVLRKQLTSLRSQLASLKTANVDLEQTQASLEEAIEHEKGQVGELRHQLSRIQEKQQAVAETENEAEQWMMEIFADRQQHQRMLSYAELEKQAITEALHQREIDLSAERQQVEELRNLAEDRVRNLEDAVAQLRSQADEVSLESQTNINALTDQLNQTMADLQTAEMSMSDMHDQRDAANKQLEQVTSLKAAMEVKISVLEREKLTWQTNTMTPDSRATTLREEIAELQGRIERRNVSIAQEQSRAKKLEFNLDQANQSIGEFRRY